MAPSIFAAIWEMENYINNRLWHIKLRLMDSAFISLSYEWMFSLNHPLILFYLKLQKKKKKKDELPENERQRQKNGLWFGWVFIHTFLRG